MSYPITHVAVRDCPPPQRPVMTVGHLYPITEETVFKTETREDPEDRIAALEAELAELRAEKSLEDEVETKVVRRGRRPSPKATEGAETK